MDRVRVVKDTTGLLNRVREVLWLAVQKFWQIDGVIWAGAFAFNAFFSLFSLIVLFVTVAAYFVDRHRAGTEIIHYVQKYIPISGEMQSGIFNAIAGAANASGQAGVTAFLLLFWVSIQCFTTLISVTNRAWGNEPYSWWRVPLKSLTLFFLMGLSVLLGIALPLLAAIAKAWLIPLHDFRSWVYALVSFFIPLVTVFLSLILFYRFAPSRRTRLGEVWVGALCAALLLRAAENLFVIYLKEFATYNAVYGALGGVMALLLWIYLSGCIFVFGVCLCVGQADYLFQNQKRLRITLHD